MERIGVRELRQDASRYLRRVSAGDQLEVTDRGRPVAKLVPIPTDPWDAMLASGEVRPPSQPGSVLDEVPRDYGVAAGEALAAMRDAER